MKDKLILVFYISIGGLPLDEIEQYMNSVTSKLKIEEDDIGRYFIPIRIGETRVECINPKLVGNEEYEEIREKVKSLEEQIEKLTKIIK